VRPSLDPRWWHRNLTTFQKVVVANSAIIAAGAITGPLITLNFSGRTRLPFLLGLLAIGLVAILVANFLILRLAFKPMREALEPIIAKVWRYCQATAIRGRTVTLKVKFADFQQITRSKSIGDAIDSLAGLECLSLVLLEPLLPTEKGVRLLGISLSSLTEAQAAGRRQLSLVL